MQIDYGWAATITTVVRFLSCVAAIVTDSIANEIIGLAILGDEFVFCSVLMANTVGAFVT